MKIINIEDIAKKINIENNVELYGKYMGKIDFTKINNTKKGKLILVTAITPTPMGEGKTTVSISLADSLNYLKKNVILTLREPSMGPVFGKKGGATGGGKSSLYPDDEINLHFTGDFHAITTANNLLCAAIDNHIYQGNKLDINPDTICFKRCLDINDRILRNVKLQTRDEHFQITAASEIMTIICLAKDYEDLKNKLENIIIGFNSKNKPIFAKELKIVPSLVVILKHALKPNLVQTLNNTPTIVHGGPFANISIGTNSYIATTAALKLADYVITEAGFGSDLGAEKFLNIMCRNNLNPDTIVIVVSKKALEYNGMDNLKAHIDHLKLYNVPLIVAINKFPEDSEDDLIKIKEYCKNLNIKSEIVNPYSENFGSKELAKEIIKLVNMPNKYNYLYDLNDSIEDKIKKIVIKTYHGSDIEYSKVAYDKITLLKKLKKDKLPICIAKTPYSLSDDEKKRGYPKDFTVYVKDISLYNGAGFIVVYLNKILTLPGLPKSPAYERIYLDKFNNIVGIK